MVRHRSGYIRRGDFPDAHSLITAGTDDAIVAGKESDRGDGMFVASKRSNVLVFVIHVPELDEQVVRARNCVQR